MLKSTGVPTMRCLLRVSGIATCTSHPGCTSHSDAVLHVPLFIFAGVSTINPPGRTDWRSQERNAPHSSIDIHARAYNPFNSRDARTICGFPAILAAFEHLFSVQRLLLLLLLLSIFNRVCSTNNFPRGAWGVGPLQHHVENTSFSELKYNYLGQILQRSSPYPVTSQYPVQQYDDPYPYTAGELPYPPVVVV